MGLGLFQLTTEHHAASWLDMSTSPAPAMLFRRLLHLARPAKRGCFDVDFLAGSAATPDSSQTILERMDRTTLIKPSTMAAAPSVSTETIGIVITQNTDYDEPVHVARRVAQLDQLSSGQLAERRRYGRRDLSL